MANKYNTAKNTEQSHPSTSAMDSNDILKDEKNRAKSFEYVVSLVRCGTMKLSDDELKKIEMTKKEEIVKKYHPHAVSIIASGKYIGQLQTRFGTGRKEREYHRFKDYDCLYKFVLKYYSIKTETLESYFPKWLDWKTDRNNNKNSTRESNVNSYNKFVRGTDLEKIPLTAISTEDLDNWCRETLKKYPLTAKRFNTYKIVVTGPLSLAVREHILDMNPWISANMDYRLLLKSSRRAPSCEKIFYDNETEILMREFFKGYASNKNSANVALAIDFDLGLRVGELSALKWSDVDWNRNTIFIQRQESEGKVEEYVKSDSAAGYRELSLNSQVISLLKKIKSDFGFCSEYIFTDKNGNRKTKKAISMRLIHIQEILNENNGTKNHIKRIHCIRRTVATRMAKNKIELDAIRQWLGHTDLATTYKYIYSTETNDSMRNYLEKTSAIKTQVEGEPKIGEIIKIIV